MRLTLVVVVVVAVVGGGSARADSPWFEYSDTVELRRAQDLVETSCDVSIELRGAIAEVQMQQRLANAGPSPLAATTELELPAGAQLVGVTYQRGRGAALPAVVVPEPLVTDRASSERVLGADPVVVRAIAARGDRPRFRMLVQPVQPDHEITVGTRWIAAARIRNGAIELQLPGRGDGAALPCRGVIAAVPGPGTTIARVRVGHAEVGARGTAAFELGAADTRITAVLAFARPQPVVWTQTAALGDGWSAQAITIATPAIATSSARRALLVIDGSRSMELVGRHHVQRLVRAIGGALPAGAELEAIVFDRTPARVLGAWKPVAAEHVGAIEETIRTRSARNGSDLAAAFTLARQVIGDARGETMVILISDGIVGDVTADALVAALGPDAAKALDLHAITLEPGQMRAHDAALLGAVVRRVGGSSLAIATHDVDAALADLDPWLRPALLDLRLDLQLAGSTMQVPDQLSAGSGIVVTSLVRRATRPKLTARGASTFTLPAVTGPAAALAQLALADPQVAIEADELARLRVRHPAASATASFVVLTTTGKAAHARRKMIAEGGPVSRMVEVVEPSFPDDRTISAAVIASGGSVLDRDALQLVLRTHLQPAAFTCYQKALPRAPSLAGSAGFTFEIRRGEVVRAAVAGLGNAAFDACLVDAAFQITPPLPNPDVNLDDRVVVTYPLAFTVREQKPFVVAGDADSSSPLDIDAIEGGPPGKRRPIKAGDTSTPLGNLRPTPTP